MSYHRKNEQYALRRAGNQERNLKCLCGLPNLLQLMSAESHHPRNKHLAAIDKVLIET